ncbi:MAG: AgmX/PglI C-terminal domain-containing protein [Deltaproteobacteria bacterium]|nr:AgmX/PglI C-terminal domain-containing protein [Deltaproteobacteria bacterium]
MHKLPSLVVLALVSACWRSSPPAPSEPTAAATPTVADRSAALASKPGGRPSSPASAGSLQRGPRARLTPHVALSTIETSYIGGLRRCYRAGLKHDASARGRVVVTFTVNHRGRLSSRRAQGVGRTIESCVERAMARWSFPPARKPDGSPGEATFRLALHLESV